jgi:NADH-ubiquinone oxidoreductase chain 5
MSLPLFILSFGSIFSGYLSRDLFIGLGSNFFIDSIFVLPCNNIMVDSEFIPVYIKLLPTFLSVSGMLLSIFFLAFFEKYFVILRFNIYFNRVYKFLINKWYFDYIYNQLIAKNFLLVSYDVSYKLFDKGFLELIGPKGVTNSFFFLSMQVRQQQTGFIYQYISLMFLGYFFFYFFFLVF